MNSAPHVRSEEEIRRWLVEKVSGYLQIAPDEVDRDEPLIAHGIDSMQFVVLVGELEDWLGCRFADNPLIDFPTINLLAAFLARQSRSGKTVIDPTAG